MVLTVTINPLLEHRLSFKKLLSGEQNRNGKLQLAAGGKGINVSRQLNRLGVKNIALTFAGGVNGKLFRKSIVNEAIDFSLVPTLAETRICTVIIDTLSNNADYYFSENQRVTKDEVEKFISILDKMIQNCEIVIFSGSSPSEEADIIFPTGIKMANKHGKISFCDTYGRHLQECYSVSPTVVHNNIDEIERSFNIKLNSKEKKLKFLSELYGKNIKQVFITNGGESSYASNFDFHYVVSVPNIDVVDSTGSGDSFVAGMAFGWHKSMVFNDQVKLATALGSANAEMFEVGNVDYEEAVKLLNNINISPVGKKLKLIDDTPN